MDRLHCGAVHAAALVVCAAISLSPAVAGNDNENWDRCVRQDYIAPQSPEAVAAACKQMLRSIAFAPNERADAFNNLAVAYMRLKRYDEAISAFSDALRATREYQNIPEYRQLANYSRLNRARAYVVTKQYERALGDFDTMAASEPLPKYYAMRCSAHALFDTDFASAFTDCKKAIDADKHLSTAYDGWLIIEYRQGKYAEVKSDCDMVANVTMLAPDSAYVCGLAEQHTGNAQRGTQLMQQGIVMGALAPERFKDLGIE